MDWPTIVLTGLSVLLGGCVTGFYARRGEKRLKEEADNLRRLNGLTIRILDEAKLLPDNVKPTKDEAGNYTGGLTYSFAVTAVVGASVGITPRTSSGRMEQGWIFRRGVVLTSPAKSKMRSSGGKNT